jgi:hypothetical protein
VLYVSPTAKGYSHFTLMGKKKKKRLLSIMKTGIRSTHNAVEKNSEAPTKKKKNQQSLRAGSPLRAEKKKLFCYSSY